MAVLGLLLGGCNLLSSNTKVVGGPVPPTPVASIPHDCTTTANADLNPDPSRYLAVVVHDARGAPIAQTNVTTAWYGPQGDNMGWSVYVTDVNGVATAFDLSTMPQFPSGSYNGMLGVNGTASTPALFTACGNLPLPGTVTVSAADAGLSTVSLNLHDGGTALTNTALLMGYTWNGTARLDAGFAPGSSSQAQVLDGNYIVAASGEAGSASYLLYQPLDVNGAATLDVDAATAPSFQLQVSGTDAAGNSGDASLALFRLAGNLEQNHGLTASMPEVHLTPGDYDVNASLALRPSSDTTWYYGFTSHKASFGPAGSSGTLAFGGPLTATLTSSKASVAPGGSLTLHPSVTGSAGYGLYRVSSLGPGGYSVTEVTIEVDGPSGTMVQSLTSPYLSDDQFTLQGSAASGTYTATLSWPLGPYQANAVTATTTFQVE